MIHVRLTIGIHVDHCIQQSDVQPYVYVGNYRIIDA